MSPVCSDLHTSMGMHRSHYGSEWSPLVPGGSPIHNPHFTFIRGPSDNQLGQNIQQTVEKYNFLTYDEANHNFYDALKLFRDNLCAVISLWRAFKIPNMKQTFNVPLTQSAMKMSMVIGRYNRNGILTSLVYVDSLNQKVNF